MVYMGERKENWWGRRKVCEKGKVWEKEAVEGDTGSKSGWEKTKSGRKSRALYGADKVRVWERKRKRECERERRVEGNCGYKEKRREGAWGKKGKRERETDIISQTACAGSPLPQHAAGSQVPCAAHSAVFQAFCFLRPAPHSIRSEIHVCLCSTEVLLKVPSWHITFKAFTVYDLGCRWGTLFRDESFPDTSHHGRELYKDPSSRLRICRYLEGDWNGLSWRKAKGIVPD